VRGSLRQRSEGSWELRVFAGRDPLTARPQYVTKTFRGGKRAAERELAAMVSGREASAPTASMTVSEALERWFEHAEAALSPATVATVRVLIDSHLTPHVGSMPLRKLTPAKVDALYRLLQERGGRKGKPLSPTTVQRVHNVFHRAMAQAVRWGWLPFNPVSRATAPRRATRECRPPSPEDVLRILDRARAVNPPLAVYLLVAAATGARRSEVIALHWSDVDLEHGSVLIGRGIVKARDGSLVEKDTKTHAARRIALDTATVAVLKKHRQDAEAAARLCGTKLPANAYVFAGSADGAVSWHPDYVTQAFARIAHDAGLSGVRLHDLRHFVATRLLASGVDVRTVAGRLGHKNPNVTLNVYAAFLPEADRDAADLLGRLLERSPRRAEPSVRR
jgi:integrase